MKPFTLPSGRPVSFEELLAEVEQAKARDMALAARGLTTPRFLDYLSLLKIANNVNLPAYGNPHFRAYDPGLAAAVTATARKILSDTVGDRNPVSSTSS